MRSILHSVGHHASTVLTFALLAGLFWWGHHTGWRLAKPEAASLVDAAWCPEHHVAEAVCLQCRKSLGREFIANEPAHQRSDGEQVRFAQVASAEALAKAGINVAPVEFASFLPRLSASGETWYVPGSLARLSSRSDGSMREILTQIGASVTQGQLLAVVEAAEVGRAKSALMQAVNALDLARLNIGRTRASAKAGVRSTAELDEGEARLRSAEVAVFDAEQALRNLGLAAEAATLTGLDAAALAARLRRLGLPDGYDDGGSANLLPLRAPRAGTVTAVNAVAGEAVVAHAPLLIIADNTALWVALALPAERASQVVVGQAVSFAATGMETSGTVVAIDQKADEQTRLVTVWARLDNPGQRLRVGVFGTATITTGAPVTSARVPMGAVQYDGDQAQVFVRRSDTVFRCLPVRILASDATHVAIDRVVAGDVVAITGTGVLFGIAFSERMGAGCCVE